jgi:cytochrome P450
MGDKNVVFMDTFHKDYNVTRKVLSAAFFKNKLRSLTRVIKQEVIEHIAEIQNSGIQEVDAAEFWRQI